MSILKYIVISFVFYLAYLITTSLLNGALPKQLPTLSAWQVGAIVCIGWKRK